jgi:galactokinase
VNLLGEHVDYNDGFVMPAAIDRATYIAFSESTDGLNRIVALDLSEQICFTSKSIIFKKQEDDTALPEWGLYPAGVAQTIIDGGFPLHPIQAVFASDVPRGSGLSSSASVEVAFFTAWQQVGGWIVDKMKKARLCQKAEIEYVGVNCGIMDQFASVCGEENRILFLDCQSLKWQLLELPPGVSIVVADTSVRRKLTTGGYNTRRAECETALSLLKEQIPGVASFRDIPLDQFEAIAPSMPENISRRARHVISEIGRTVKARQFLERGDLTGFGQLINETHISLRDDFEVSCSELNVMVDIAQSLQGCLGARLTGAGFGGCTVNLVETDKAESFIKQLIGAYSEKTGLLPAVYLSNASDGAGILKK